MTSRARANESMFRHTAQGREALAPPGEGGEHVHYQPRRSVGLGCITSRPQPSVTFYEVLAYEMGISVVEARDLYARGLIK